MAITIDGAGTITGISVGGLNDGIITPAELSQPFTAGTAVASTSGTSIDFTGIPSWVKRITVLFDSVSLSGTTNYLVQIGAGSVTTSGYAAAGGLISAAGTVAILVSTNGFPIRNSQNAANIVSGILTISLVSGNAWVSSYSLGDSTLSITMHGGGKVSLSGTLDRIRITTVNGTDTFDAGSINILYE
jgi:hypothetical protein